MDSNLIIRSKEPNDSTMLKEIMDKDWGGEPLVVRGEKYYPTILDGLIILGGDKMCGFLSYEIRDHVCEIIAFEIYAQSKGIGTLALNKLKEIAQSKNCNKLYLMTTNDNVDALRFYQKRGFHICGIHLDSVKISRKIKPSIPDIGDHGIPLRDEIDLEMLI
jgi:GNAT superfamily N-acetyltransferase